MFKKITNACVTVVNKYLPDAFLFAVILTIIVFIAAMVGTGQGPLEMLAHWGSDTGFWGLLSFSMQMVLVLVLGGAMASAKPFKNFLAKIAGCAHSAKSAVLITSFVAGICMFLNWGFALVAGALLAREVARRVKDVDYRLLIASAYAPIAVWHAGISGSIPLTIAGPGALEKVSGGLITNPVPVSETIFHPVNLCIVALMIIAIPLLFMFMHPDAEHTIAVDPALLPTEKEKVYPRNLPAEKVEQSKILWIIVCVALFAYIIYNFYKNGFNLSLNSVNFIFLFVGILLHGDLRHYIDAINENVSGAAGIILQFPFYAGIMGLMVGANADGVSLASIISNFFVSISTPHTFPLLTYISAGIINIFVPSGGGQWAVQGPIVLPAAVNIGANVGLSAQAIAYGDAWTNLIQPFWALPALGIAGLSARDIMGYCVLALLLCGIITGGGLYIWALVV